jgi:hypothetical protein
MIAIAIATLLSANLATHQAQIEHRGQRYDVAHRAHVETSARTVGAATGSKPGIQRCRWTATVRVERTISRNGAASATLLPAWRTVEGDRHGACNGGAVAVQDARVREAAAEMVAAAREDRATTLAAIDAAHGLAAN